MIYLQAHGWVKFIFLENQEQLDKMLKIWNRLPNVKKIIVFDSYVPKDIPNVTTLNKFIQPGVDDDSFEEHIEESDPNDAISFIYTSGTTGNPKAGVISNSNVISSIEHLPEMLDISQNDLTVAYLPLAHIAERLLGHFLKLVYGNQTAFAESIEDMPNNVRQVGPSIFFGTPRVFEKFYAKIATAISDATSFQKKIYHWAISIGKEISISDGSNSFFLKSKGWLAKFLIYNKIMDIFGGRIRYMISGAAPISPDIINFFKWMNITILEGYGMTEGAPTCNNPLDGTRKILSVGKPVLGIELEIVDIETGKKLMPPKQPGEIRVRGSHITAGYLDNIEETNNAFRNGWLYTGDIAYVDEENYVFIIDRVKEMAIISGFNVFPREIDEALMTHPEISEAATIALPHKSKGEIIKSFLKSTERILSVFKPVSYTHLTLPTKA